MASWRAERYAPAAPGPRHPAERYDQTGEAHVLAPGDRMFVPCEGGPCLSRVEQFPPRLEIDESGGTYVLLDIGPRSAWRYLFVPAD